MSYATVSQLRAHAQIGDNLDDGILEIALSAAVGQVDAHCRRTFGLSNGTRRYRADRPRYRLWIDDVVTVEEVTVDGTVWDESEWELAPFNADVQGKPFTILEGGPRLLTGTVDIIGAWGWPEVPPAVQQATILQASRLAQRRNAAFGIAQVPGYDGSSGVRLLSKLDADVELLLDPFRRHRVMVG